MLARPCVLLLLAWGLVGPAAAQLWPRTIGTAGSDSGQLVLDADGNLYVAGAFSGTVDFGGGPVDAPGVDAGYLVKYDPEGAYLWAVTFGGATPAPFFGNLGLAVDGTGHVYLARTFVGSITVGGTTHQSAGREDFFLAKFDAQGTPVWSRRRGTGAADILEGLAVDAAGHAFVTGFFAGTTNLGGDPFTSQDTDLFLAKYDPDGEHLWSLGRGGTADEHPQALALDAQGGVYVAGFFGEGSGTATTDLGGTPLTSEGTSDAFLARYEAATGAHQFSRRLGGPSREEMDGFPLSGESGNALAITSSGEVHLAGFFRGTVDFGTGPLTSAGQADVYLVKLDAQGETLWARRMGGPADDFANTLAVSAGGAVFIGGTFQGTFVHPVETFTSAGESDLFFQRLDAAGASEWVFALGGTGSDFAPFLQVQGEALYVAARFQETVDLGHGSVTSAGATDVFITRYDAGRPGPVGIEVLPEPLVRMDPPFPNPFTQQTRLVRRDGPPELIRVEVYDALGRHVVRLYEGLPGGHQPIVFEAAGLPSGRYFIRVTSARHTETYLVVLRR